MVEVVFNYDGIDTMIQCNKSDKMSDIIEKFLVKTQKKGENLYYLYNGSGINKDLTFDEQANELDKNRNKMNIVLNRYFGNQNEINEIISKDIICPICKENTLIDINNFKINFHGCKNNHNINDILLDKYEETQKIDLNMIICDVCKRNSKGKAHKNLFYICNTCNKNICSLCKSIHDNNHIIINYDDKNYICKIHNEPFTKYCKSCNGNICIICEKKHNSHDIIDFKNILIDKEDINKAKEDLKNIIDKFKWKINIIKETLDRMINKIEIYYNISNDIINNYNINKRNFYKLQNLHNLKINNEIIIKDLTNIINSDKIFEIYKFPDEKFYNKRSEIYIGEAKKGLKEGKGIIYYVKDDKNKRKKYEGDFKNDKMEGKGIYYWNDGDRYEGDWKNGVFDGKGTYYYNNGDKYEGDFKNDKREGKGIMNYNNGNKYEGDWKNDVREGKGKDYHSNGDRYEGDCKNDKAEGKGIFYWKNGDRYEGEWKNNKKEGKGIKYYVNGKVEEGNWKNDEFLGK